MLLPNNSLSYPMYIGQGYQLTELENTGPSTQRDFILIKFFCKVVVKRKKKSPL